ncbi:MAG: Outer rane receptor protein mostly Fe transport, partial [Mucilaginibacter sp.]|nr:Outer rane receptor protein mostly Fe transport [Mucilaginibacter sp.]
NNILQSEDHNAIDRNAGLYQVSNLHFYTRSVSLSLTYRFGSGKSTKVKIVSGSADEQKRAGN